MGITNRHLCLSLFFCISVAACGGGDMSDLNAFMAEKRAKPGGIITPIPTFKAYEAFAYSATALRSPFDRPVEVREIRQLQAVSAVKPDESRAKEFLEQYTFDSLRMVGGLARAGIDWVLVRDPDGGIHRVTLGHYMGRNHGKIVEMAETYVAVIEIVSDGTENGWASA